MTQTMLLPSKRDRMIYYAFVIAFLLHIILFYTGVRYPELFASVLAPNKSLTPNPQSKPLEFTFVDVPEKNVPIKQLNRDALASDRDRISAAKKPEHFDLRANNLPEMHGDSKNLVIERQQVPQVVPKETPPVEKQDAGKEIAKGEDMPDNGMEMKKGKPDGVDQKKLSESIRNLDKYIARNELRSNPASSYEPDMPPDSDLWLDTQGVDLGPWARQVHIRVRNNWIIPLAAKLGFKGKVSIDFEVLRNGTIKNLIITSESGVMAFDQAAMNALAMSNPLPPLPAVYPKPILKGRFSFYYNVSPNEK